MAQAALVMGSSGHNYVPAEDMLYGKYYSQVPHITRKKAVPGRRE